MSFLFIDLHVFLVIMQVNGLISVATFASLIITVISVNCIGNHPCRVLDWEAWGPCVGVCGFNFQERKRALCCPLTVKPRTVEHCVQYCNTTGGVTERRYCPFCGNGTFQYDSLSCQCNPRFKGKCCQGKYYIFMVIIWLNNSKISDWLRFYVSLRWIYM